MLLAETVGDGLALLVVHDRQVDVDRLDALEGLDGLGDASGDLGLQRTARHGEGDGHGHAAPVDGDLLDHVEVDDRLVDLRVLDRTQGLEDGGLCGHGVSSPLLAGGHFHYVHR